MHDHTKTLLLVSPFVPYPPARGIELRIDRLLRWLKKEGYRVVLVIPAESIDAHALEKLGEITFAVHWTKPALRTRLGMRFPSLRKAFWEPLKSLLMLSERGREARVLHDSGQKSLERSVSISPSRYGHPLGSDEIKAWFSPDKLTALVAKLARKYRPQAVIVEYIFSTPVLVGLPAGTIKIVDTIDVFSRKEDQVLAFGISDPLACSEDEERRYLLQADVIVAIQSREAGLLKALVPEREVLLAGMDFDVTNISSSAASVPHSVAVVASDNPLNVHGLSAFLTDCWPSIKAACPDVTLHVVGRVGSMCRIADPSIRYSGWIEDLDQVYREASVIINPTIAGTGLKIKSVQALAHGKPLVAWTNGVEGLEYDGAAPFLECRSWQEFGDAVVRLLRSDIERNAMAAKALSYAQREFSASKVYASLGRRLAEIGSLHVSAETADSVVEGRVVAGTSK
jgi:glycosyltransferase involved in cell wall biosynthesis